MDVDHPNIVKFYQCVYDNKYINIVMELVEGQPLSNYLIKNEKLPEKHCQIIMRQFMHAIKYVHSRGIVHRDLKLDNVMISGTETGDMNDIKIKLIDFGMAKLTERDNRKIQLKTYCGTIDFIAPEILAGKTYGQECDLWSAGVIAYFILAGSPPFLADDEKQIAHRILRNNYDFVEPCWHEYDGDVSLIAQEFISSLLELEPKNRSSPENALAHPWLSGKQSAK